MENLPAQDLKALLEVCQRALKCDRLEDLQDETLRLTQDMFAAKSSVFIHFSTDGQARRFREGAARDTPASAMRSYCGKYHHIDPLSNRFFEALRVHRRTVIASDEVIGHDEWTGSDFYNEFLRPLSIYHAMLVWLVREQRPFGALIYHRPRNAPGFSSQEVTKATLIAPHLSAAFINTMIHEQATERNWIIDRLAANLPYQGFILLNQALEPIYINDRAVELLRNLSGDRHSTAEVLAASLPDLLFQCCCELKSQYDSNCGTVAGERSVMTLEHNALPVSIRLRPLRCGEGMRFLVRLETTPHPNILTGRVREFGLSQREMDVVHLVSAGLSNNQIADELSISIHTVRNHLCSIYEKTSVHNRTALLHRMTSEHEAMP